MSLSPYSRSLLNITTQSCTSFSGVIGGTSQITPVHLHLCACIGTRFVSAGHVTQNGNLTFSRNEIETELALSTPGLSNVGDFALALC